MAVAREVFGQNEETSAGHRRENGDTLGEKS